MAKLSDIFEEETGLEKPAILILSQLDEEVVFKRGKIVDPEDIRIKNKSKPEPKLKFKIFKMDFILLLLTNWIAHIKKLLGSENWE